MTFKVGDKGQRYEVRAKNKVNQETFVVGWVETSEGVDNLKKAIELHPSFYSPTVIDRQAAKAEKKNE